jgi:hypothetical protein
MITIGLTIIIGILCIVIYEQRKDYKEKLSNLKENYNNEISNCKATVNARINQVKYLNKSIENLNLLFQAFYEGKSIYTEKGRFGYVDFIALKLSSKWNIDESLVIKGRSYSKNFQEKFEEIDVTKEKFFLSEEERKQYLIDVKLKEVEELMK